MWWTIYKVAPKKTSAWADIDGNLHSSRESCRKANSLLLMEDAKNRIAEKLRGHLYGKANSPSALDRADGVVSHYAKSDGGIAFLVDNLDLWPEIKGIIDGYKSDVEKLDITDTAPRK